MAQVGVQQPANLMEMFSSGSPMMWDIASQQINDQTLGNLLNRQQAQQSMDIEKQKLPLELSRMGFENQGLEADLPLKQATAGLKQNERKLSDATMDDQLKAKISGLAKTISDDHLTEAENGIKMMMSHPDPQIRAKGKQMMPYIYEIAKERDKLAIQGSNNIAVAKETGNQARLTDAQAASEGKYAKSNKYGLSLSTRLDAETDPRKKLGLLAEAAQMAAQEGNQEAAAEFTQRAQALQPLVQQWLNANAKPGAVDIAKTAPGIAVNPTPELVPTPAKPSTAKMNPQQYQSWHDKAKQLNPNLSDVQIEQEAKSRGYK